MTTRTLLCTTVLLGLCLAEAQGQDGYLNWLGRRLGVGWSDGHHAAARGELAAACGPHAGGVKSPDFSPTPVGQPTPVVPSPPATYFPTQRAPFSLSPVAPSSEVPVPFHQTAATLLRRSMANVPVGSPAITSLQRGYFGEGAELSPLSKFASNVSPGSSCLGGCVGNSASSQAVGISPRLITPPYRFRFRSGHGVSR